MQARTILLLTLLGMLPVAAVQAQDIRDDEADVFLAIEREWQAAQKADQDEVDEMLTDDFMGWGYDSPAPRSKRSTSLWSRLQQEMGSMERYELYPLSITVHEDTAVAHYLYSMAVRTPDDKIETTNGRYTDVLIRTGDGWKFIAWHGGRTD